MKTMSVEEIKNSLSNGKKNQIMLGCILLMLTVAAYGVSISTILSTVLERMDALDEFSLVTVLASVAACIATPLGGRFADMVGTKNVILIGGLAALISGLILPFMSVFLPFMIFRFLLAFGIGIFVSSPYTLLYEIYDRSQVPQKMGLLSAALALGSIIGSFGAGYFADHNQIFLALAFPCIFLILGIPLVYFNLPQKHIDRKPFDLIGFILMSIGLTLLFLGLNEAPKTELFETKVLLEVVIGLAALIFFCFYENKQKAPLIPMRLFKNKEFSLLLAIGFLSMFFLTPMFSYLPLGVTKIIGASNSISGVLQLPRSILLIVLPVFLGTWIVKKPDRTWKALLYCGIFLLIAFVALVFIGPKMPIWFVMTMVGFTGISEAYRSISITPAAQSTLELSDLGIGTSLLSFINTLSGVIAGVACGAAYDTITSQYEGIVGITRGIDTVFLIIAASALLIVLLTFFVYRPIAEKKIKQQA